MTSKLKIVILSVLFFLAGGLEAYQTKNVVVLVIDGPRQSECWADPSHANIPNMATKLAPLGSLLPDFKNNGPTYTNAGHTALATGYYEELENSQGTQLPSHPGIFQYYLKKTGSPATSAWVITSKGKLKILSDTSDPKWQGKWRPSFYCGADGLGGGYGEDLATFEKIKETLNRDHPRLLLINLKEPDSSGHTGIWKDYLKGMRASDEIAWQLWEFLQADPFYRDQTAYLITHDHGRHLDGVADGFKSHGDACAGCRAVALLALGPDFKRGAVIKNVGEQIDIPVTIASMLGFKMPGLKGRVLKELFR
jgi:hypothetical protein